MLVGILGTEWFHTYIRGCQCMMESDHKPLDQIQEKNMPDSPVRLPVHGPST